MNTYDELKEWGATDEEIRDAALDLNSDNVKELLDWGATSEEIFSLYQEDSGIPSNIFLGLDEPSESVYDKLLKKPVDMKYFNKEDVESAVSDTPKQEKTLSEDAGEYALNWLMGKEEMVRGAATPVLKLLSAGERFFNKIGIGEEGNQFLDIIKNNDKAIESLNKKLEARRSKYAPEKTKLFSGLIEYDPLDVTEGDIAELMVEYLPASALKTIRAVAMGEGLFQGVMSYGEGKSGVQAGQKAFETAATTYIGGKAIEKVLPPAFGFIKEVVTAKKSSEGAYKFLVKKVGATENDVNKWNTAYADAIGKDVNKLTPNEKIEALLNNSENAGILKRQAEYFSPDALAEQARLEELFQEMVSKETQTGSFDIPALKLKQYIDESGSIYGDVENALITHYNNTVKFTENSLDGLRDTLTRSSMSEADNVVVKRILADLDEGVANGITVDRLLAMKHDLNTLNLKSTKKWKAGQVGEFIDKQVEKGVGEEGYSLWKEANQRYAAMKMAEGDNELYTLLDKFTEGRITPKVMANKIASIDEGGYKTFNQMRLILGEKASASLEREVINSLFATTEKSSEALAKLDSFEFATTEGRGLYGELQRLKGMIPDDAAKSLINKSLGIKSNSSVGWSDDIIAKARYGIIGQIWNKITSRLPSGSEQRAFQKVAEVLKKQEFKGKIRYNKDTAYEEMFKKEEEILKKRIKELNEIGANRTTAQNKELADLKQAERNIAKQLEWKYKDAAGKNQDVNMITPAMQRFENLKKVRETYRKDKQKQLPKPSNIQSDIPMGYKKPELIEPDEILDAEIEKAIDEVIDIEQKQLPKASKLTSDIAMGQKKPKVIEPDEIIDAPDGMVVSKKPNGDIIDVEQKMIENKYSGLGTGNVKMDKGGIIPKRRPTEIKETSAIPKRAKDNIIKNNKQIDNMNAEIKKLEDKKPKGYKKKVESIEKQLDNLVKKNEELLGAIQGR